MRSGKYTLRTTGRKRLIVAAGLLLISSGFWNTGCKKDGENSQTTVQPTLELVTDNLTSPVTMVEAPDNTQRMFVVDEIGKIWIVMPDGRRLTQPFIDIASLMVPLQPNYDERGLLGLAFHPNFKSNGKFYVFYTAPSRGGGPAIGVSWNNVTRISEFRVTGSNPNIADPSTERIILEENHPALNHNGGTLAFGPDGYLYISIGDGGDKDDVGAGHVQDWYSANAGGNAQNLGANLMGKMLRIDVNSGSPYSVPSDNPFVSTPNAKPEIYAFGFRNPYRFSFDMGGSHDLYLGDAGQSLYEEIDLVTKGGNYGWNVKEGSACFNTDNDLVERSGCPSTDIWGNTLIDPIAQLNNVANPAGGVASAIVGGYVYRGSTFPQLQGSYIFGSYAQRGPADGKIYVAAAGTGKRSVSELVLHSYEANVGAFIKGFGQNSAGEIYVLTSNMTGPSGNTGKVYKLVAWR